MNKSYYYFGIFIFGLYVLMSLFQNVIYIQIGPTSFFLGAFLPMFFLMNSINILGTLVLLKYYRYRKYENTFWTTTISAATAIVLIFIFYNMVTKKQSNDYYFPAYFVFLGFAILNSLTLIFSNAGKRFWLKATGIVSLIAGIFLTVLLTWFVSISDVHLRQTLDNVASWISPGFSLIPVLIIMNFVDELKAIKEAGKETSEQEAFYATMMGLVGTIAIIAAVMLGFKMNHEKKEILRQVSHLEKSSVITTVSYT
ncbi:hypothetical protein [Dyadobacter diqingensis]|uniref:hypothetical protein n=1 Tax=Dyadobacter diqingensis TaxID=2938121 RepID=UPI0020C1D6A0|nr:hypothetical protein [Dyadobacter diqingensis]